ncbi:hypothetical protein D3C71_2018970 [compost metagenome]
MGSTKLPVLLCNWSIGAVSIYRQAHRLGFHIGTDLLVMCADHTLRNQMHMIPSLSVMDIPYVRMGEMAVHAIFEQIQHDDVEIKANKLWVNAQLIAGESA